MKNIIIGIDASNIKSGGGIAHIVELINNFENDKKLIYRICIWASEGILNKINDRDLIIKNNIKLFRNSFFNALWKVFYLNKNLIKEKCDLLFVPSGSIISSFKPVVLMSQNMLPFESKEMARYGFSFSYLKLLILKYVFIKSCKTSNGLIFLHKYARKIILSNINNHKISNVIISHGISQRFFKTNYIKDKNFKKNKKDEFNIIYVSSIEPYKHHDKVINAINLLIKNNYRVKLSIYGSGNKKNVNKLINIIKLHKNINIKYHGSLPHETIHSELYKSDIAIFASTCENFPNILLEYMAVGLPILCHNKEPMKSILKDGGLYFDVENIKSIYNSLCIYISNPTVRLQKSKKAQYLSKKYSWKKTSEETFNYLYQIYKRYNNT